MSVGRGIVVAIVVLISLLIIAAVTLMAVGYVRGYAYYDAFQDFIAPRRLLTDIAPTLKTGDILLFIASAHGFTNSMLTHNVFSHVGMVIESLSGGELLLSESTRGSKHSPAGAALVLLWERINNYCGQIFLMRLAAPLSDKRISMLQRASKERCPYPSFRKMLSALFLGDRSTRHCFQHVAALLEAAGMVSDELRDRVGYFAVSGAIADLPEMQLPDGIRYESPIEIVRDADADIKKSTQM